MGASISIPVLGRLRVRDWLRLLFAATIIAIEIIARTCLFWLPREWVAQRIKRQLWSRKKSSVPQRIQTLAYAPSASRLARCRHFPLEVHFCTTKDGYILTLHRLPRPGAPAVLLWHGFMMSSEVWLCHIDPNCSLAFVLYSLGYDVWLGNTRGNKYSWKHEVKGREKTREYYDYSLDELAKYDVPDTIDFVLQFTGQPTLTYIGFSQGTAQGFAALSLSADLQRKVNLFVALAAVMKPKVLQNSIANALVQASPELIFLIFGRERMIAMAHFWTNFLPRWFLVECMRKCLLWLFGWTGQYISDLGQYVYFGHLYSYTSVKSNVHWFQIMHSNGGFTMYDDYPGWLRRRTGAGTGMWSADDGDAAGDDDDDMAETNGGYSKPRFPVEQITTPVAIFSGGQDTLSDVKFLRRATRRNAVFWLEIEEYEHLDFLWAEGVDALVIPAVVGLLRRYARPLQSSIAGGPSGVRPGAPVRAITYTQSSVDDGGRDDDPHPTDEPDIARPIHPISEHEIEWLLERGTLRPDEAATPGPLPQERHLMSSVAAALAHDDAMSTCSNLGSAAGHNGDQVAAELAFLFEHHGVSARQFLPRSRNRPVAKTASDALNTGSSTPSSTTIGASPHRGGGGVGRPEGAMGPGAVKPPPLQLRRPPSVSSKALSAVATTVSTAMRSSVNHVEAACKQALGLHDTVAREETPAALYSSANSGTSRASTKPTRRPHGPSFGASTATSFPPYELPLPTLLPLESHAGLGVVPADDDGLELGTPAGEYQNLSSSSDQPEPASGRHRRDRL